MFKNIISFINQGQICSMKFPKAKLVLIKYVIQWQKIIYSDGNYFSSNLSKTLGNDIGGL